MGKPFEIIHQTSLFFLRAPRLVLSFLFLVDFILRLAQVGRRQEHRVYVHLLGHRLLLQFRLLRAVLILCEGAQEWHGLPFLARGRSFAAGLQEVDHLARFLYTKIRISLENGRGMDLHERYGISLSCSAQ